MVGSVAGASVSSRLGDVSCDSSDCWQSGSAFEGNGVSLWLNFGFFCDMRVFFHAEVSEVTQRNTEGF